jgi:hypothetical protein
VKATNLVRWACAGIVSLALFGPMDPAAAEEKVPPTGQETTCADVLAGEGAHEQGFEQATDPSKGSEVRPGDVVEVRMTWKADDFTEAPLYHALGCVTVDGDLNESLSRIEPKAENDGEFTHSFTVPEGLPAGSEICTRGAIAGDGNGYFELNKTNIACFGVVQGQSPPPAVPAEVPPAPAVAAPVSVPQRTEVQVATEVRPAPIAAPAVAPAPAAQLPRTGRLHRELLVWAGLLLALGGGAITGTTRKSSVGRQGLEP